MFQLKEQDKTSEKEINERDHIIYYINNSEKQLCLAERLY